MIRRFTVVAALVVLLGACGGGGSSERQVLVDFSPDTVATFVAKDFPGKVSVLPGQTIAFKQTWTGEPHTVTGGKVESDGLARAETWFALFDGYTALFEKNPSMVDPEETGPATFADFAAGIKGAKPAKAAAKVLATWRTLSAEFPELPDIDNPPATLFRDVNDLIDQLSGKTIDALASATDDNKNVNQNIARPCYLETGAPPEDVNQACSTAQQRQPAFDGTQSFYNSGVLPYEGPRGNTFRMQIAKTTKPGKYLFFCAVHGPDQRVEVDVVKPGTKVPSASAEARAGRKEAEAVVAPMVKTFRTAEARGKISYHGKTISGPFAGLPTDVHGTVNEFVPETLHAKAGSPVTWKMIGDHTISFDVPPYLPILQFTSKSIRYNPKVKQVAGGAPELPAQDHPGVVKFDAGTYSGSGFWSSGLIGGDPYIELTLRIAKPGTYPYACLVHPKMIGRIVVS